MVQKQICIKKCPRLKSSTLGSFLLHEKDINAMTVTAVLHYTLVKTREKVDFEFQIPRFGVLVLKYSSYNAVFL